MLLKCNLYHSYGFFQKQVWEKADSSNGYVHQFQVYTGRAGNPDGEREVGLAGRVVLDLTRDMLHKNHHVYMDNFFSSPTLFSRLLHDGIYACGTVRTNRQGYPQTLQKGCVRNKGDHLSLQKGNMVATAWFDNKQVSVYIIVCPFLRLN